MIGVNPAYDALLKKVLNGMPEGALKVVLDHSLPQDARKRSKWLSDPCIQWTKKQDGQDPIE